MFRIVMIAAWAALLILILYLWADVRETSESSKTPSGSCSAAACPPGQVKVFQTSKKKPGKQKGRTGKCRRIRRDRKKVTQRV